MWVQPKWTLDELVWSTKTQAQIGYKIEPYIHREAWELTSLWNDPSTLFCPHHWDMHEHVLVMDNGLLHSLNFALNDEKLGVSACTLPMVIGCPLILTMITIQG